MEKKPKIVKALAEAGFQPDIDFIVQPNGDLLVTHELSQCLAVKNHESSPKKKFSCFEETIFHFDRIPEIALGYIPDPGSDAEKLFREFEEHYLRIQGGLCWNFQGQDSVWGHNQIKEVEPHTELALAHKKFCLAVFPKLPRFRFGETTPANTWFALEVSRLKRAFEEIGLFGTPKLDDRGKIYGKTKSIKERRELWKTFKDALKKGEMPTTIGKNYDIDPQLLTILLGEAFEWALSQNDETLEKDIQKLIKAHSDYLQTISKGPNAKNYQIPAVIEGALHQSGKSKKRKRFNRTG